MIRQIDKFTLINPNIKTYIAILYKKNWYMNNNEERLVDKNKQILKKEYIIKLRYIYSYSWCIDIWLEASSCCRRCTQHNRCWSSPKSPIREGHLRELVGPPHIGRCRRLLTVGDGRCYRSLPGRRSRDHLSTKKKKKRTIIVIEETQANQLASIR